MSLAGRIDPEELIQSLHDVHISEGGHAGIRGAMATSHLTPYGTRYASQVNIPKWTIPQEGSPSDTTYQIIHDELDLDGKPNLNLASFVSTFIEPNAAQLINENLLKNLADNDEYPSMLAIHERCVSILAHLWGSQKGEHPIGSATTGSSEAIHLGGLAMKQGWKERRQALGKDTSRPNIIMGANAQVALEKFARYFDVEARILPVSPGSHWRLDVQLVKENLDENTIGIFVIMGSTYTGHYEPVAEISEVLDEFEEETGIDIPIHVDAASGGFVAPFTHAQAGGPQWNFELPRVKSINVSGHKYGLVPAGLGWIVWRDQSYLPEYLVFELTYLGGTERSFTLNFSRPGAQVIVQYYNLIHLGFEGYREIMENCLSNARLLSRSLEATGWYTCLSDIHRRKDTSDGVLESAKEAVLGGGDTKATSAAYLPGLPVVAFRLSDEFKASFPHVAQDSVSQLMRARQWIIPNYPLPPGEDQTEVLRVVIRESMSFDLLDRLITDLCQVTQSLIDHDKGGLEALRRSKNRHHKPEDKAQEQGSATLLAIAEKLTKGIHKAVC